MISFTGFAGARISGDVRRLTGCNKEIQPATPQGQTCSAGVAEWDGEEGPDALLARADAALYEAKSSGRNRTAVATA